MRIIPMTLLALCVLALCGEAVMAQDAGSPVTSDLLTPSPAEVTAPAADPAAPTAASDSSTKSAGGLLSDLVRNARGGQWRLVIASALGLLMLGLARVREHPRSPFKGDRGGAALVLLLALAGSFGTALASNAPLGVDLVVGALGVAFTAAGGFVIVKRLIWPKAGA